jgi:hypothetical protein
MSNGGTPVNKRPGGDNEVRQSGDEASRVAETARVRHPMTAAVLAALDADEMFDHAPGGDPPITTGQYRRITRAVAGLSATTTPDEYSDGVEAESIAQTYRNAERTDHQQ